MQVNCPFSTHPFSLLLLSFFSFPITLILPLELPAFRMLIPPSALEMGDKNCPHFLSMQILILFSHLKISLTRTERPFFRLLSSFFFVLFSGFRHFLSSLILNPVILRWAITPSWSPIFHFLRHIISSSMTLNFRCT